MSKDAAIPCVGIESSVGRGLIPRQVTIEQDDSRGLDRISYLGRPAVDADEELRSADDPGRFSDIRLAAQVAVVHRHFGVFLVKRTHGGPRRSAVCSLRREPKS